MNSFATTDWVLLGILTLSLLLGIWRGLVHEFFALAAWIVAFFVAQWFAPLVSTWLPLSGMAPALKYAVAYVVVFIATVFAVGFVSWLMRKLLHSVGLAPADRALGGLFGLVRGVVVLLALTVVVQMVGMHQQAWWQESYGAAALEFMIAALKPVLPEQFSSYLP